MSHLVQLRQRIAATQITQKTTNAMRLIAMSSHTRLRHIKDVFDAYKNQLNRLLNSIKNSHKKLQEVTTTSPNKPSLVIVIGSQKGLCGNFNTSMAEYFIKNPPHLPTSVTTSYTIIVGKQLKNTLLSRNIVADFSYDQFSSSNYRKIAKELSTILRSGIYSTATIYFTYPQSFFIAKHTQLPLNLDSYNFSSKNSLADEVTSSQFNEQSYSQTYKTLSILSLDANLESILIDSLLAEQAARFLAMDTATRNAEDLINRMKLDYNKLRQAAITRELTDLSGSFIK